MKSLSDNPVKKRAVSYAPTAERSEFGPLIDTPYLEAVLEARRSNYGASGLMEEIRQSVPEGFAQTFVKQYGSATPCRLSAAVPL